MNFQSQLPLIQRVSKMLCEALGDDFDAETFWDTLEGETNAVDLINHVLRQRSHDKALAEATRAEAADLSARAKRFADRDAAHKKALQMLLDATGQRKVETPLATVSRQKVRASVQITNEAFVPRQLCKTTVTPDKNAIKKQLEAGETVPGAALVAGHETISIRVK